MTIIILLSDDGHKYNSDNDTTLYLNERNFQISFGLSFSLDNSA